MLLISVARQRASPAGIVRNVTTIVTQVQVDRMTALKIRRSSWAAIPDERATALIRRKTRSEVRMVYSRVVGARTRGIHDMEILKPLWTAGRS